MLQADGRWWEIKTTSAVKQAAMEAVGATGAMAQEQPPHWHWVDYDLLWRKQQVVAQCSAKSAAAPQATVVEPTAVPVRRRGRRQPRSQPQSEAQAHPVRTTVLHLPDVILQLIFRSLDARYLSSSVRRVCKRWAAQATHGQASNHIRVKCRVWGDYLDNRLQRNVMPWYPRTKAFQQHVDTLIIATDMHYLSSFGVSAMAKLDVEQDWYDVLQCTHGIRRLKMNHLPFVLNMSPVQMWGYRVDVIYESATFESFLAHLRLPTVHGNLHDINTLECRDTSSSTAQEIACYVLSLPKLKTLRLLNCRELGMQMSHLHCLLMGIRTQDTLTDLCISHATVLSMVDAFQMLHDCGSLRRVHLIDCFQSKGLIDCFQSKGPGGAMNPRLMPTDRFTYQAPGLGSGRVRLFYWSRARANAPHRVVELIASEHIGEDGTSLTPMTSSCCTLKGLSNYRVLYHMDDMLDQLEADVNFPSLDMCENHSIMVDLLLTMIRVRQEARKFSWSMSFDELIPTPPPQAASAVTQRHLLRDLDHGRRVDAYQCQNCWDDTDRKRIYDSEQRLVKQEEDFSRFVVSLSMRWPTVAEMRKGQIMQTKHQQRQIKKDRQSYQQHAWQSNRRRQQPMSHKARRRQ